MVDDRVLVHDGFETDVPRGRVVGSETINGAVRTGVDRHRSLAVDHGALRVVSLTVPGWGSTSVAYGPFDGDHGLAFGAFVLNGHNTSQSEPLGEPLISRIKRWMKGNEVEPWPAHVLRWMRYGRRMWTLRRFAHWARIDHGTRRGNTVLELDENLSVGLLPEPAADPTLGSNSFVMHATGADNGELWVATSGSHRAVLTGVRNVPLFLLVVVSGDRVLHFGASVAGVAGLPALPDARLLAATPVDRRGPVYPSIQQAVSGQIGFAADSRVWEAVVADVHGWLSGEGAPAVVAGGQRLVAGDDRSWQIDGGPGLIRVSASPGGHFSVVFRGIADDGWRLRVDDGALRLVRRSADVDETIDEAELDTGAIDEVQITDDGRRIGVYLGDELVFRRWIDDDRDADAGRVAVHVERGEVRLVEVYRRHLRLPAALRPATALVRPSEGLTHSVVDRFEGPHGDLDGRRIGDVVWSKAPGDGRFLLDEGGARVDASAESPLPGRVVYTVPVSEDGPFELEIDVVPPGTVRGHHERGRAGVVFEQDDGNALFVSTWLDDGYAGASISSFFRLGGFEDLFDAIWTNVGEGVTWGRPYRLRVAFDGLVYEVFLDDELVLYRSLVDVDPNQTRLRIRRVGIVANWEWGTDTGSVFRRFVIRTPKQG